MSMTALKIGSLFSGYGGLDMAVESVTGARTAWVSDIDKGACKILAHRYPDVPNLGDLTAIDWAAVEPVDIITGGFPCQDLSHAGKRAGMADGTRSGLWSYMCDAINIIRPRLVVAENVRGLLSAEALRPVEPCTWCVGDDASLDLRALGAVLADLADIGYDASWYGLRAADIGACHGRFRVFLVAYPQRSGRERIGSAQLAGASGHLAGNGETPALLPTPRTSDTNGAGAHGDGGVDLRTAVTLLPTPTTQGGANNGGPSQFDRNSLPLNTLVTLLPTPRAGDGEKGGPNQRGSSGDFMLPSAVHHLLPTPTAADSNASGGSSPSDVTLTDAVVRTNLGEQENPRHASTPEGRPDQVLPGVRNGDVQEAIQRALGGSDEVSIASDLLEDLREQQGVGAGGHTSLASSTDQGARGVRGLRDHEAASRSSRRQGRDEQRSSEPGGAVRVVSSTAPLATRPRRAHGVDFGQYEAAIQRWEAVLGRGAPSPTEPTGKAGAHRLSPRFTEWLMGLPVGWITDVPGITRNEALKACGNGVVPQQAAAALRTLLAVSEVAA